jgi:hypothetical protein
MHQPSKVYEVLDSKGKFKPELHHLDGHVDVPDQAVTLQTGTYRQIWALTTFMKKLVYHQ